MNFWKEKMNNNLMETDTLSLFVKKERKESVIKSYECFGWEVAVEQQSARYENVLEIKFIRPHFIKNKDDLQFMQVNMERDLNNIGKLDKQKHQKSTIISLTLIPLWLIVIALNVLAIIKLNGAMQIITGVVLSLISIFLVVNIPILLIKTIKKEKLRYREKYKELKDSVKELCERAQVLLGGNEDEN